MTSIFYITKHATGIAEQSKAILREQFGGLGEGQWKVVLDKVSGYERPTRYRYYFGVVLTAILEKCGRLFSYTSHRTGEQVTWSSTTEVHEYMKLTYNPHTLVTPRGIFIVPGSSREISDREFVNEFMEQIMADFSQPPYLVEFLDVDTWREQMKAKHNQNSFQ